MPWQPNDTHPPMWPGSPYLPSPPTRIVPNTGYPIIVSPNSVPSPLGPLPPIPGAAAPSAATPIPQPSSELPLFTEKPVCIKCGCRQASTQFTPRPAARKEVLRRTCKRCTFTWDERPLDQAHELELLAREAPSNHEEGEP